MTTQSDERGGEDMTTTDQVWQCTHCGDIRVLSMAVRAPRCQGLYQLGQSWPGAPVDRSHWPLGMRRVGFVGEEIADALIEQQRAAEPVAKVDVLPVPPPRPAPSTHQPMAGVPWWSQTAGGSIGAEEVL